MIQPATLLSGSCTPSMECDPCDSGCIASNQCPDGPIQIFIPGPGSTVCIVTAADCSTDAQIRSCEENSKQGNGSIEQFSCDTPPSVILDFTNEHCT